MFNTYITDSLNKANIPTSKIWHHPKASLKNEKNYYLNKGIIGLILRKFGIMIIMEIK